MNLAPVINPKCRRCSKHRPVAEFIGGAAIGYCLRCYEGHNQALDILMGKPPTACTACERSFRELSELTRDADLKLYLHPMDGLYAVLCKECSDNYETKRRDLYAGTAYGLTKKL